MSLVMSGIDIMHTSSSSRTRAPSLAWPVMPSRLVIHLHASSRQRRHWRRNVKLDAQRPGLEVEQAGVLLIQEPGREPRVLEQALDRWGCDACHAVNVNALP